jgi:acyl carrier protein
MISWPCILKLNGDDELIYLGCEQDFFSECRELIFSDDDYIIDSVGLIYLIESISEKLALAITERQLVVDEVTHLIRANEFIKAELCLTKIHFLTISDAIKSLHFWNST